MAGITLYPLLGTLLREWKSLLEIGQALVAYLKRSRQQGIYEILDYETTLELSATGKTAHFLKRQKVRFLQNHVISFQDRAWGDGEIFADYQCAPGIVADRYQIDDRWNILISLRETKSRGDIEEFFIQATYKDSYLADEEWQQVEIRHQTCRLKMTVIFPKRRHCRRAVLHERRRNRTTVLAESHFSDLPDGRQALSWETRRIRQYEVYTLRWRW